MPRLSRTTRLALLLLILGVATGFGPGLFTSAVAATTPKLTLSSSSGYPNEVITISVAGFPARKTVSVTWDGGAAGSFTSSSNGSGSFDYKIPSGSVKGAHTVRANRGSISKSATFTVKPRMTVSPTAATSGQALSITLRGFAKSETVSFTFDASSKVVRSVTVSTTGRADLQITMASLTKGSHGLNATGNKGTTLTVSVSSLSLVRLSASSGKPGKIVNVSVRGFGAGEQVEIQLRSDLASRGLKVATASSSGSVNVDIKIPTSTKPGSYTIRAVGYVDSLASTPFTVT